MPVNDCWCLVPIILLPYLNNILIWGALSYTLQRRQGRKHMHPDFIWIWMDGVAGSPASKLCCAICSLYDLEQIYPGISQCLLCREGNSVKRNKSLHVKHFSIIPNTTVSAQ